MVHVNWVRETSKELRHTIVEYMESVASSFTSYLNGKSFLRENAA